MDLNILTEQIRVPNNRSVGGGIRNMYSARSLLSESSCLVSKPLAQTLLLFNLSVSIEWEIRIRLHRD